MRIVGCFRVAGRSSVFHDQIEDRPKPSVQCRNRSAAGEVEVPKRPGEVEERQEHGSGDQEVRNQADGEPLQLCPNRGASWGVHGGFCRLAVRALSG